jgi:hypothetical protein
MYVNQKLTKKTKNISQKIQKILKKHFTNLPKI